MSTVFVNGCFDVLHVGHLRLLRYAATFGAVTVAINSDESVKRLKGPGRPMFASHERQEMLMSLRYVEAVRIFDEDTPERLLSIMYKRGIGPKYVIKGADYKDKPIPEQAVIEANGGTIVFAEMIPGLSTTKILEKL